jgi:hypothetical protein
LKQFPLPAGYNGLADVVAAGMEALVEEVFRLPDEGKEGGLLVVRRVKEVSDVVEGVFRSGLRLRR